MPLRRVRWWVQADKMAVAKALMLELEKLAITTGMEFKTKKKLGALDIVKVLGFNFNYNGNTLQRFKKGNGII